MKIVLIEPTWKTPLLKISALCKRSEYETILVESYGEWFTVKGNKIVKCDTRKYKNTNMTIWKVGERVNLKKYLVAGKVDDRIDSTWKDLFRFFRKDFVKFGCRATEIYAIEPKDSLSSICDIFKAIKKAPKIRKV